MLKPSSRIRLFLEPFNTDATSVIPYSAGYFKEAGRYDNNPKPGDQVFFRTGGVINHTGIVTATEGDTITVVEGNAGNRVRKVVYRLPQERIDGYGHPFFGPEARPGVSASPKGGFVRRLYLQRPYMTGEDVKAAQRALEAAGFASTWVRTDYRFSSAAEAEELIGFFFGPELAARVAGEGMLVVPECTGIWWRHSASAT